MRHRSKEINIFSMSALDLFASGMGAFILLAVMALPFFPNTGAAERRVKQLEEELANAQAVIEAARRQVADAERRVAAAERRLAADSARAGALEEALRQLEEALRQLEEANAQLAEAERSGATAQDNLNAARELADLKRQLEEANRRLAESEKRAPEVDDTLSKAQLPDLDLVICLDVSGSMEKQIEGLKRQIRDLALVLDSLAPSAGIGVVAFGDRRWVRPIHVQDIVLTGRLRELERFVGGLQAGVDPRNRRNSDYPEAIATALEQAMRLGWRPASKRRYIIAVTDAGVYPDRKQAALEAARSFAAVEGQHVSAVMAWRGPDNPEPFLRNLASAGRGRFLDMAGGDSMLASILLAILGI